ncbi:MAG: hypothetical protein HPY44_22245 [Armatimonadetes bacterium]|nr:hypothetical protein [Armatimonadota bacterium]
MNRPWLDPADFPSGGPRQEQVRFLLGYAILAPSSHNSQPWLFRIVEDGLEILADDRRWLRVADADLFADVVDALTRELVLLHTDALLVFRQSHHEPQLLQSQIRQPQLLRLVLRGLYGNLRSSVV